MATLTSRFNSRTNTQKRPKPKSLQKSSILAFPLSLCSGANVPCEVPEEERLGENYGQEEGEIGHQSPGTPPPHSLDTPTPDKSRDSHKSNYSYKPLDFKILEKIKFTITAYGLSAPLGLLRILH